MFAKRDKNLKKSLDQAGRRLVQASGLSADEAKTIASSPFLFARIRARVRESESEDAGGFLASLGVESRRAIPAMGLAAVVSVGLFLYLNGAKSSSPAFSVDAYLDAGDSGIDNLAIAERRLTAEEVLTTIVSREREAAK